MPGPAAVQTATRASGAAVRMIGAVKRTRPAYSRAQLPPAGTFRKMENGQWRLEFNPLGGCVMSLYSKAFDFELTDEDRERIAGEIPRGRKLWLTPQKDGDPLEYVLVEEGVTDDSFTELVCANAASYEGREAVVGYQTDSMAAAGGKDSTNPFMPKFPKRGQNKGTAPEPKK